MLQLYLWHDFYNIIFKVNSIIAKEQYGFNINSSTEAASYDVINEILKAIIDFQ